MKIVDAIEAGLKHNHAAYKRVVARKISRKAVTCPTFEHVFTRIFMEYGYGKLPPLTKKDWGMLKTFLVVLQGTGWDRDQIFDLIKRLISQWKEKLAGKEITTLQFKKMVLPPRPNIRALLFAKTDILAILYEDKKLQGIDTQERRGFSPKW